MSSDAHDDRASSTWSLTKQLSLSSICQRGCTRRGRIATGLRAMRLNGLFSMTCLGSWKDSYPLPFARTPLRFWRLPVTVWLRRA